MLINNAAMSTYLTLNIFKCVAIDNERFLCKKNPVIFQAKLVVNSNSFREVVVFIVCIKKGIDKTCTLLYGKPSMNYSIDR